MWDLKGGPWDHMGSERFYEILKGGPWDHVGSERRSVGSCGIRKVVRGIMWDLKGGPWDRMGSER